MICLHMIEGVRLGDGRFAYRCEVCGVLFGVSPAPGRLAARRALVELYWAVDLPAQCRRGLGAFRRSQGC